MDIANSSGGFNVAVDAVPIHILSGILNCSLALCSLIPRLSFSKGGIEPAYIGGGGGGGGGGGVNHGPLPPGFWRNKSDYRMRTR